MAETIRKIERAAGFAGEIGIWVSALEDVRRQVRGIAGELGPAQLAWNPPDGGNSIGRLLRHIALVELDWVVTDICGGTELPPGTPAMLRIEGAMADPGERPGPEFIEALDFAREHTKSVLRPLPESELDAERRYEGEGERRRFNVRWILHHLVDHEAQHKGQILAVWRQLKRQIP